MPIPSPQLRTTTSPIAPSRPVDRDTVAPVNRRSRGGHVAWLGLAAILAFLTGYSVWVAFVTDGAAGRARAANEQSVAYSRVLEDVSAEASAARRYALLPRVETRAALMASVQEVRASLAGLIVGTGDAPSVTAAQALHEEYVAALSWTSNGGTLIPAPRVDGAAASISDRLARDLSEAADRHRALGSGDLDALAETSRGVLRITPVVFLVGFLILLLFRASLRTYDRRLVESRDRELVQAQQNEERFRALVQNATDVILVLDREARLVGEPPSIGASAEFASLATDGRDIFDLVHPDDVDVLRALHVAALEAPGVDFPGEARLTYPDGRAVEFAVVLRNLLDLPSVGGVVATLRDISERNELEAELTRMAFRDSLTGLPNRALFADRLEQALQRAARTGDRIGVIFVDLDNFKLVNDALGHARGDELLIEAAGRIQSVLRGQDSAARIGGDEFTVLIEGVADADDASLVATRVADALRIEVDLGQNDIMVTASVGVALSTPDITAEEMLRNADLAMYRAKSSGKAHHEVFDPATEERAIHRIRVEGALRRAHDRGEFVVHYQPIVALASGDVMSIEALVRWQRPGVGLVPPGEFIPMAEEIGLIGQLGQFVLERAAGDLRELRATIPSAARLRLNVNISAQQFRDPTLPAQVSDTLSKAGLQPSDVLLELTESTIMEEGSMGMATLGRLAATGVGIAIDDFGTGYSSLRYLRQFPVNALKIDRSFVAGLPAEQDAAIVRSILTLARELNLKVTAEGIETEEQRASLIALGCEFGQGYFFARPVELTALRTLLTPPDQPRGRTHRASQSLRADALPS